MESCHLACGQHSDREEEEEKEEEEEEEEEQEQEEDMERIIVISDYSAAVSVRRSENAQFGTRKVVKYALSRTKPEEILVEVRSDSDVQLDR